MGKASRDKGKRLVVVRVPVKVVNEANKRGKHWGAKADRAKVQRRATESAVWGVSLPDGDTYLVTLVRIAPRAMDDDGISRSLKAVRDQVAKELGYDDSPSSPIEWAYEQRSGKVREYAVEIRIMADPEPCPTCGRI